MPSTAWTHDIRDQEEKAKFLDFLDRSSNDIVLVKLKKILRGKLEAIERSERKTEVYNMPNWHYLQADNNGTMRTLTLVLQLLDHVEDK